MSDKCTARNGGYNCQFEFTGERHEGMHYAYYTNALGLARVAYWVDQYSAVNNMKAPVPNIPPGKRGRVEPIDPRKRTIFPVLLEGKIHAAFLMDEAAQKWATRCGLDVKNPGDVQLAVKEVECQDCLDQIERAREARRTAEDVIKRNKRDLT